MMKINVGLAAALIVFTSSTLARTQDDSPTEVVLPEEDEPADITETTDGEPRPTETPQQTPVTSSPTGVSEQSPLPGNTYPPQPEQQPAEAAPLLPAEQGEDAPAPEPIEEPEDEKEDESVFSWFSLAPEVGYVFYPGAKMTVQGFSANVEPRNGFLAKLHFDLGGDGLAFEMAPLFAVEAGGINASGGSFGNSSIDLSQGLMSGSFQAIGAQISLVYRFKVGYFFPNLGLSFHGTYLMGDKIDFGTELYARIPLGFTVYMGPHVGFVFEVGLMYGVTGIKTPLVLPDIVKNSMDPDVVANLQNCRNPDDVESWYSDNQAYISDWLENNQDQLPQNYDQDSLVQDFVGDQLGQSIRYGAGFGIDITIGLRFP